MNPGPPKLLTKSKESGRQFHMLQACQLASRLTGGKFKDMEDALLKVLLEKAYYSAGRGIVYETQTDWSFRRTKNGQPSDWVTSEAMGCALEALFSLTDKEAW